MRILYIDIDSQRPDHFGCYGYHRNTTPTIDRIASEGVRFNNVYASDAPCLPSRTAFYSGRFGIQTGVVGHGGTAAEPKREGPERGFKDRFTLEGMASRLRSAGYHCAMISPFGDRHSAHWFYAGFHEIHNTGYSGMESAEQVMPVVNKWMDDHASNDDWYLHINFWDPHTPFRVPDDYGNPFEDEPIPEWITEEKLEAHKKMTGPHTALDPGMYGDARADQFPREVDRIDSMAKLKQWFDGYDTAVRYVDDQIDIIINKLKAAGVYDDTAIIISADHGENLGELGIYSEHGTADQITCNVPMIVKWPGGRRGTVDDALHYNLDWAPTICDLLGVEDQPALWDGQSYAGAIVDGKGPTEGHPYIVFSQCCHVAQRSVRWDDGEHRWLYMRTYHDGFHLFPDEMLFDLATDPHEEHNLAEQQPDVCGHMARQLDAWHSAQMQKMSQHATDMVDPLWQVVAEGGPFHAGFRNGQPGLEGMKVYLERLEQTGRTDGANALREKYSHFLG